MSFKAGSGFAYCFWLTACHIEKTPIFKLRKRLVCFIRNSFFNFGSKGSLIIHLTKRMGTRRQGNWKEAQCIAGQILTVFTLKTVIFSFYAPKFFLWIGIHHTKPWCMISLWPVLADPNSDLELTFVTLNPFSHITGVRNVGIPILFLGPKC